MVALLVAIGAIIFLALVIFLVLFNRLIRLRNKADNAWHQIDVELLRRHDLVPELNNVVEGYAMHEKNTLAQAAQARSGAMEAETVTEKGPAEDHLTSAIRNVFAVAEAYPDLKANTDFLDFQKQLSETETRIAGSRKYYNGAVMYYNNARQGFPGNMVAAVFSKNFGPREYFEIQDPSDRQVPSTA